MITKSEIDQIVNQGDNTILNRIAVLSIYKIKDTLQILLIKFRGVPSKSTINKIFTKSMN